MFEEKKSFPWKIPALVLVCVLVLSSGIYIGIKSRNTDAKLIMRHKPKYLMAKLKQLRLLA